jgi:hypothetical protein
MLNAGGNVYQHYQMRAVDVGCTLDEVCPFGVSRYFPSLAVRLPI